MHSSALSRPDDRRLLRLASLALAAAVWVLGLIPPPAGFGPAMLAAYSATIAALMVVDATAPERQAGLARRLLWLAAELGLAFAVVRIQGSLTRPSLIYLLPASRALLMFGQRTGLLASLSVWAVYAANVGVFLPLERYSEFPNYLSFFLGPYTLAVFLTIALLRQAGDRERLQLLYDELSAAHDELQALQGQAEEAAVTRERNRMAREIHDSVAHYLTVVNLQLEAVEKLGLEQPQRAVAEARRARRLTIDCLREVRRSVAALRSATLEELSLPGALKKLVADFADGTGLDVRLDLAIPDDLNLASDERLALYRAAQEGLTNVQRHAQAHHARVSVSRQNGSVELAVEDDGAGPGPANGGFGLIGLRERVELLGGRLNFGAAAGAGTRLAVTVPVRGPSS